MHGTYTDEKGRIVDFDLDSAKLLVASQSGKRRGWSAVLVYVPATQAFVELRSSPPEFRGNSQDEAEQVDAAYVLSAFQLSSADMARVIDSPSTWRPIDRRSSA